MIRATTVKHVLWFITMLFVVLSFPIQVYTGNPNPSLFPYVLIALILVINEFFPTGARAAPRAAGSSGAIGVFIAVYVTLVIVQTAWQGVVGLIPDAMNALVINLLPVVFYWYFRRTASETELRTVLVAMVISGLVVGAYFAYDSYLKLALGQVSEYTVAAFQYSVQRSGQTMDEVNPVRIVAGYRSFGLLESHSVSGAWVILGALAAMAWLPQSRRVLRRTAVMVFGVTLLMGLNFTAILSFSAIMFVLEFGGETLLRGRVSATVGKNLLALALVVLVMAGAAFAIAGEVMGEFMGKNLAGQVGIALGTGPTEMNMARKILTSPYGYAMHVVEHPFSLVIGDGFSAVWGRRKGGDVGLVESAARFGLPFYIAAVIGLMRLCLRALQQSRPQRQAAAETAILNPNQLLRFAAGVIALVLIMDLHYQVWSAKSVLPMVFLALALFERYLVRPSMVRIEPVAHVTTHPVHHLGT